jgi:long-chain acyl-CoA synthetase
LLIDHWLERSAARFPDRVALVCQGRRLTYREVNDASNRFGTQLIAAGVQRGDRVVVFLENSVEAVIAIFGILRAGAAFVPVGPSVKANKLGAILEDSGATALVADHRVAAVVSTALDSAPSVRTLVVVGGLVVDPTRQVRCFDEMVKSDVPAVRPALRRIDLDLASLVYTSGSTGRPKGVTLTHLSVVAAATSIGGYLGNTEDDVILDVLPLSFDYGLYQVFLAFQVGARLILERSFVYPAVMLDLLEREKVTALPMVPTLAAMLLKYDLTPLATSSLRYVTNTGAALPPAHISALRKQLPGVRIFSMYGLTECKRVSFLTPEEIDERPDSVGKPMDNVEVYVADDEGNLSATGEGELVIRGSNVMSGYWQCPDATQQVLMAGRYPGQPLLRSGDRFRIDGDGYMYFLGRIDDMIKSRGQRVSPKEVENVIYEIAGVTGVAVVGVPDPLLGMSIKATVSIRSDSDLGEQDILRHCARQLEDHMVPHSVEIVPALPRLDSGKIDRRLVRTESISSQALSGSCRTEAF